MENELNQTEELNADNIEEEEDLNDTFDLSNVKHIKNLKIFTYNDHIRSDEMETTISICKLNDHYGKGTEATIDTTYIPDFNKCVKRGWILTTVYQYSDGRVFGGRFIGPKKAISIRSTDRKRNVVFSDEQRAKIADRLKKYRESKE